MIGSRNPSDCGRGRSLGAMALLRRPALASEGHNKNRLREGAGVTVSADNRWSRWVFPVQAQEPIR